MKFPVDENMKINTLEWHTFHRLDCVIFSQFLTRFTVNHFDDLIDRWKCIFCTNVAAVVWLICGNKFLLVDGPSRRCCRRCCRLFEIPILQWYNFNDMIRFGQCQMICIDQTGRCDVTWYAMNWLPIELVDWKYTHHGEWEPSRYCFFCSIPIYATKRWVCSKLCKKRRKIDVNFNDSTKKAFRLFLSEVGRNCLNSSSLVAKLEASKTYGTRACVKQAPEHVRYRSENDLIRLYILHRDAQTMRGSVLSIGCHCMHDTHTTYYACFFSRAFAHAHTFLHSWIYINLNLNETGFCGLWHTHALYPHKWQSIERIFKPPPTTRAYYNYIISFSTFIIIIFSLYNKK